MTWEPLWLSFKIATIATIATAIAGVAFALLLQWKKLPARDLIDAIISVPLVLPPTVLGYYLLAVIAAAVGSLPLVVRSARVGLESIDPNLLDAARTLGASPMRVLVTVRLPLALPGIAAGLMMGFARALGDYGATMMVYGARPGGVKPASIYVMDELHALDDHSVFIMSASVTVFGVAMLFFANRLTRKLHRA